MIATVNIYLAIVVAGLGATYVALCFVRNREALTHL